MKCEECNSTKINKSSIGKLFCDDCLMEINGQLKYSEDYKFVNILTLRTKKYLTSKDQIADISYKLEDKIENRIKFLYQHKQKYWKIYLVVYQIKLKEIAILIGNKLNILNKELFINEIKSYWFKIIKMVKEKEISFKSDFINENTLEFIFNNKKQNNDYNDEINYDEIFNFDSKKENEHKTDNIRIYNDLLELNHRFKKNSKRKIKKKVVLLNNNKIIRIRRKSSIKIDPEIENIYVINKLEEMIFNFKENNINISANKYFEYLFNNNNTYLDIVDIEYIIKLYSILKLNLIDLEKNVKINKKRSFKHNKFINLVKIDIIDSYIELKNIDDYYIINNNGLFMVLIFFKDFILFKYNEEITTLESINSYLIESNFIDLFNQISFRKIKEYLTSLLNYFNLYKENKFENSNKIRLNLNFSLIFVIIFLGLKKIKSNILISDYFKLVNKINYSNLFKKHKIEEKYELKENLIFYYKEKLDKKNISKNIKYIKDLLNFDYNNTIEDIKINFKNIIIQKLDLLETNSIYEIGLLFFQDLDFNMYFKNINSDIIISWIIWNSYKICFYKIKKITIKIENGYNLDNEDFLKTNQIISDMILFFENLSKLIYNEDHKEPQIENIWLSYNNIKRIKLKTLRNIYFKEKMRKNTIYENKKIKIPSYNKIQEFLSMIINDKSLFVNNNDKDYLKINKYFNYLLYLLRKYFLINSKEFCYKISKLDSLIL